MTLSQLHTEEFVKDYDNLTEDHWHCIDCRKDIKEVCVDSLNSLATEYKKILAWTLGEDTGSSSKALCRHMLGLELESFDVIGPCDASDRGRCIRLLNLVPEWWNRLDEMALLSEYWAEQIPLIREESVLKEKDE